jgi:glutamate racemase
VTLSQSKKFNSFLKKKQVTILITDSGLGGLSICAEIASELKRLRMFEKITLIYFNAWPEQNRGYNRLRNTTERIQVFDTAIEGMLRFKPDFIMIACNTLSILYPHTRFSKSAQIPVVDIVGFGVDIMTAALGSSVQNCAVILGTLTTIESHVHHDHLIQNGIQPRQIISQPCDQLATEIEKGPDSTIVSNMIETYMQQAAQNVDPESVNIYAALCCTHFGYCKEMIRDRLASLADKPVTILNPNRYMAACLFDMGGAFLFSDTTIEIQVLSKIIWEERKIKSISRLIASISDETAQALKNYTQRSDLFG